MYIQANEVPHNYTCCQSTTCPLRETCLHHIAWQLLPQNRDTFTAYNPAVINESGDCDFFRSNEQQRFAKGFVGMQKKMFPGQYVTFKYELFRLFGRTSFYECRRGNRLLSPEEQEAVRKALKRAGADESLEFDAYEDQIAW